MTTYMSTALAGVVACWVALLVHELGHAIAAQAVGVRMWGIRLGLGPTVWRGTFRGLRIHLCAFPLLGGVTLLDEDAGIIGYRDLHTVQWNFEWGPNAWRAPIISASGGLTNFLGALMFLTLWRVAGQPELGSFTSDLLLFGVVANLSGYLNLLPCGHSDGNHLLRQLSAARASFSGAR
jgi:membrane-associated protease RseP (regulator of RpoE activity)